jgi:Phage derived protein Gp49-like (DUF891).
MAEEIRIVYLSDEYNEFYNSLDETSQNKVDKIINYIKTNKVIIAKYAKKLGNSKSDLYEILVSSTNKREYRILSVCIDNLSITEATEILLLNGFLKKSNKDYKPAMKKADKIIDNYFDEANN